MGGQPCVRRGSVPSSSARWSRGGAGRRATGWVCRFRSVHRAASAKGAVMSNGMRADRRWHEGASGRHTHRTTAGRRTLMTKPCVGSSDQADAGDGSDVDCQARI